MKAAKEVAIIGAGFSGLAAAWDLVNNGYSVTVFEADNKPGGLASGFIDKEWSWSLEKHYHHIFETDKDILKLLKDMRLESLVFFRDTKSLIQYNGEKYQLDSPLSLLKFSPISFFSRIRTGVVLAFLKLFPYGQVLERFTAQDFLIKTMGKESYRVIWEPLFVGKFGEYAANINMAWFWARIHARSKKLGYFEGGFLKLAEEMVRVLEEKGVKILLNTPINKIKKNKYFSLITKKNKNNFQYDKVLITTPAQVFSKLVDELPNEYAERITKLKGLAAITLVLELEEPFFNDRTYWLNINEKKWPFLAVVEHTNFVESEKYGTKNIVYVGKYLKKNSSQFKMSQDELLKLYLPYLKKISPGFAKNIKRKWVFKEVFAQPIVEKNHSKLLPKIRTPLNNLYWASMQHVYPWDRGVNFAVKIGREASVLVIG